MTDFTLTNGNDVFLQGGQDNSGDDRILGLGGMDQIDGGDGNDEINGGTEADTLNGGAGDGWLDFGLVPGQEFADGGAGIDTIVIDYAGVINLGTGQPISVVVNFSTGTWQTLVDGFNGVTVTNSERLAIDSSDGNDVIRGGALEDTIDGNGGNDLLRGGSGNDWMFDSTGVWDADGGPGSDLLFVGNTAGTDTAAALVLDALAGTIACGSATSGSFTRFELYNVAGTTNADSILTANGSDVAKGGGGNDSLNASGGHDSLDGGTGTDTLIGGAGNDTLSNGEQAVGAQAADNLDGGDSNDWLLLGSVGVIGATLSYSGAVFAGGAGNDRLDVESALANIDLTGATLSGIETISYSANFNYGVTLTAAQINGIANYEIVGRLNIATAGAVTISGIADIIEIRLFEAAKASICRPRGGNSLISARA